VGKGGVWHQKDCQAGGGFGGGTESQRRKKLLLSMREPQRERLLGRRGEWWCGVGGETWGGLERGVEAAKRLGEQPKGLENVNKTGKKKGGGRGIRLVGAESGPDKRPDAYRQKILLGFLIGGGRKRITMAL